MKSSVVVLLLVIIQCSVCHSAKVRKGRSSGSGVVIAPPLIDPCNPNPCEASGYCQSSSSGYQCTCINSRTGSQCQDDLDPPKNHCDQNPCPEGQTCSSPPNIIGFTCA